MVKGTWFHARAGSNGRLRSVNKIAFFVKTSKLPEPIYLQLKSFFSRERLQVDIREGRPEPHLHAVNELSNRHALRAKEIMLSRNKCSSTTVASL